MNKKKIYNRIFAMAMSGLIGASSLFSPVITATAEENEGIEAVEEPLAEEALEDDDVSLFEEENESEAVEEEVNDAEAVSDESVSDETTSDTSSFDDNVADADSNSTDEGADNTAADGSAEGEDSFQGEDNSNNDIPSNGNSDSVSDQNVPSDEVTDDSSDATTEDTEITDDADKTDTEGEITDEATEGITENVPEEEEPKEEKPDEELSWSADSDGITVYAKAKAGILPDGADLRADRIWGDSVGETLDDHGTDYDGYAAFDIYFVKDDEKIEPDGDVSITFELHDIVPSDADEVEVKHFDESGENLDVVTVADTGSNSDGDVSVDGNSAKAEFAVSSFSTFAIIWKQNEDAGWPESTYLNVTCKDQHGNLLTDEFVPDLVVLDGQTEYKVELNSDNDKIAIDPVGSGTTAIMYTFTSAEAVIKGETTLSNVKAISAEYSRSESKWLYTVAYMDGELEKTVSGLTSDEISLTLYYSNEDVSLSFNLNGGTGTVPDTLKGKGGTKVVLPNPEDYGISYEGYTFLGWSEVANLRQDTTYHEVLKAGDEYYLPASGSKTLYAAWTSTTYGNVQFYIRLDAKVAPEPTQYGNALYTSGVYISGTAKEQRWMIDMDATEHDGVNVKNSISENMETLPTANQLKTVINDKSSSIGFTVDVNDEGRLYVSSVSNANNTIGAELNDILYVHWYVQKMANSNGTFWNVDGVLLTEKTIEVTYHGNPNGTDISNLPAGYQINPGTDVTVGVTGAPSADSSHSLLYTTKTGYELVGWNTAADGTGTTYKVGDVFRPTKDITLYAMWSKIPRGGLKITKQVTGKYAYADETKEYRIRVSINSSWVNGAESAVKYTSVEDTTGESVGSGVFTGTWTDTNGKEWSSFDFTLKDGQSIVISGLYDNTIYMIDELESGYDLTYDGYDKTTLTNNRVETNVTKNVVMRNGIEVVETDVQTAEAPFILLLLATMLGAGFVFMHQILRPTYLRQARQKTHRFGGNEE